MVRTRRSLHGGAFSPDAPKRQKNVYGVRMASPSRSTLRKTNHQESYEVLMGLLRATKKGTWYRILPVCSFDDATDDIQKATGIPWDFLLPLLCCIGLVYSGVTSTVKKTCVCAAQWQELACALSKHVRLQVTSIRRRGLPKEYFFCAGTPRYSSPTKQDEVRGFARLNHDAIDTVRRLSRKLLNHRCYIRIMNNNDPGRDGNEQQEEANDENEETEGEVASIVDQQINFALQLNFNTRPRVSRSGITTSIQITTRKIADERARHLAIHTAIAWGWLDPYLSYSRRNRIAQAACMQVGFDLGYTKCLAHTQLPVWYSKLNAMVRDGDSQDPMSPSHAGSKRYVSRIDKAYPGYLHELFRYAQLVKGSLLTFVELSEVMNAKSATPGENRPTLSLSRKQVRDWFFQQGGQEKSPLAKPLLTNEHKELRVAWARKWFQTMCDPNLPVAFLDEKWFYTTNRRRRLKVLPKGGHENEIPEYQRPKIRSRRYPVKVSNVMFVQLFHSS